MGGVTGVIGAAAMFTHVGPPLLLASLLFGGGSTAVTAGNEMVNYRSEPRQMADRILVLFDVLMSLSEGMERVLVTSKLSSRNRKRGSVSTTDDEGNNGSDENISLNGGSADKDDEKENEFGSVNVNVEKDDEEGSATLEDMLNAVNVESIENEETNNDGSNSNNITTSSKIKAKSMTKTRTVTNVTRHIP
eukprot:3836302-Ditylum_brightwellii.AAC.1